MFTSIVSLNYTEQFKSYGSFRQYSIGFVHEYIKVPPYKSDNSFSNGIFETFLMCLEIISFVCPSKGQKHGVLYRCTSHCHNTPCVCLYRWPRKLPWNERRRYIYNGVSHWLNLALLWRENERWRDHKAIIWLIVLVCHRLHVESVILTSNKSLWIEHLFESDYEN